MRYPQTINDFCREAVYMSNCLSAYVEALTHNCTKEEADWIIAYCEKHGIGIGFHFDRERDLAF